MRSEEPCSEGWRRAWRRRGRRWPPASSAPGTRASRTGFRTDPGPRFTRPGRRSCGPKSLSASRPTWSRRKTEGYRRHGPKPACPSDVIRSPGRGSVTAPPRIPTHVRDPPVWLCWPPGCEMPATASPALPASSVTAMSPSEMMPTSRFSRVSTGRRRT
jgi:hypothetical protein